MLRRLVVALILLSVGVLGCEEILKGTDCCALQQFCTTCTTCTSDQIAAANKGDEAACTPWVTKFRNEKQFCNPEDKPPQHTIDEFVLQCEQ